MRNVKFALLAGLAVVSLSALPVFPRAQQQPAPAAGPAQPAAADCSSREARSAFVCSKLAMEHWQQSLQARIQRLSARMAKQVAALQSEELAKLQAEMSELQAASTALAAQARQAAAGAQARLAQEWEAPFAGEEMGWLGVEIAGIDSQEAKELKLPEARGVLIVRVLPEGPAAKAGLQSNDVVLQYDRREVEGTVQFRRLVRETPPGRTVPLVVIRNGKRMDLSVEVGNRRKQTRGVWREFGGPAGTPPKFNFHFEMPEFFLGEAPILGIDAENLSGQLGAYFGAPGGEGVLVREVQTGSPAEKAGLKVGDVIVKVEGTPVKSISDLREQLREKREQKAIALGVIRKGAEISLTVVLERHRPVEGGRVIRRAQT